MGFARKIFMTWHLWDLVAAALTLYFIFIDILEHVPLNQKSKYSY
jgi:hypothetical protein